MNKFGEFLLTLIFCYTATSYANVLTPAHPDEGVVGPANNSFMDPNVDYSRFMGRVTDKDDTGKVLKVHVENNNTKFLKTGDIIRFTVNNQSERRFCKASVRTVEDFYFSMYVLDFDACWEKDRYFPRGMQLNFKTKKLADRVFEAAKYRELLILRKEGFIKQLNDINHFLWTYDQQRLKAVQKFDEKINALKREKRLALDNLIYKKQENILLQAELTKKIDSLDESLDHYKVERQEYMQDRWAMDHDRDLPFVRRPQKIKNP